MSVDIGLKLQRKAQASWQGCSPGNLNLATFSMEPPQAECSAKRRRLTHRDMHVAAWTEGSSSEKKESACEDAEDDSVEVKKEKVAELIHSIDKDVQWLKVKKEIKDDMEQDMKSSNFDNVDGVPLKEVEVKDEMENDAEDHDKSPQKSEVAVKQEVRRRLTRKVQVAAWTETSSSEKPGDDGAKIKMETIAEHEASFASPLTDADGHEDAHTRTLQHPQKARPEPNKVPNLASALKKIEKTWTGTNCYEVNIIITISLSSHGHCRFVIWSLTAANMDSMDGGDQNEKDRWVRENNVWHFQVIPIMHMAR